MENSNKMVLLLANQMKNARELLIHTMHGITPIVNNRPDKFPVTIGARMAHIGSLMDMMIVGGIGGKTPLAMGDWKDKTGYSIPHPGGDISEWAPAVEMEIKSMHQYVLAVMEEADKVIATLSDEDLNKKMMTPMGEMTIQGFFEKATTMMLTTAGEISTLRVLNGLSNGYPE